MALVLLAGACGRGEGEAKLVSVPGGLVPTTVDDGRFQFIRNDDETTKEAFANAGDDTLVSDGEVWELRNGEALFGTLQLSTVKPGLDLREKDQRDPIIEGLMPGAYDIDQVGTTKVWSNNSRNKRVYLWFGRNLYVVFQFKTTNVEADPIMEEIVTAQTRSANWEDLVIDDES